VVAAGLHHPLLRLLGLAGQPGDRPVVLDPENDVATVEVEKRRHLLRQARRVHVVPLELDPRALTVAHDLQEFCTCSTGNGQSQNRRE